MREYKNIPVHPIVMAILPLLLILQQNMLEIGPWQIWRSVLFSTLFVTVLWATSFSVLRDLHSAALISSLGIALFYAMGRFHSGNVHGLLREFVADSGLIGNPTLVSGATLGLFVVGSFALLRLRRYQLGITIFLNIVGVSLLTGTMFIIGSREWTLRQPLAVSSKEVDMAAETTRARNNPDILIILLDGYGRSDVLSDLYQFDNTPFLQELEQMGFHTIPDARSNYMQTSLSVAASLNFNYLQNLLRGAEPSEYSRSQLLRLIHHSQFKSTLREADYVDFSVASGYRPTDLRFSTKYLHPDVAATNLFERLMIENSGLGLAANLPSAPDSLAHPGYQLHRDQVELAFEVITDPPTAKSNQASWTFLHLISPHPPFVYDESGDSIDPGYPYVLLDGSAYPGAMDTYRRQYIQQLKYINNRLLLSLESLVRQRGDEILIVVHADHGPGSELVWESLKRTNVRERFGILLSYRMPGGEGTISSPIRSPVNAYRGVLNELFDTDLSPLEERSYFSTWDRPFDFQSVAPHLLAREGR